MPPRFSVIMPTHQAAAYIGRAIASVVAQTFGDWELVVVDNGSTDGTQAIVEGFQDPRIHYTWQEDSGLPANSRNAAIRQANGEYVAFLDADDRWDPGKLAWAASEIADDPRVDVLCHAVDIVGPDDRVVGRRAYMLEDGDVYAQLLYRGGFLTTSAAVARRSAVLDVGLFDERRDFLAAEDYDLWLKLARAGARFVMSGEVLGEYLQHPGGTLAGAIERGHDNMWEVLHTHYVPLARSGRLDVKRATYRRTRSTLSLVRSLVLRGRLWRALVRLLRLPGELASDRAAYRSAAAPSGDGGVS